MRLRTWTDEALIRAVATSDCWAEVALALGLVAAGNNNKTLQARATFLGLDSLHFSRKRRLDALRSYRESRALTYEDIFCEHSHVKSACVGRYIRKHCLLPYECLLCGNAGVHNGSQLVLQVDHINGVSGDNRLENIRWLCPNCHSQTDTFAGRGRSTVARLTTKSRKTDQKARLTKIQWPSKEKLTDMVDRLPVVEIAKQLGVSDVAVKKYCVKLGIQTKGRGGWGRNGSVGLNIRVSSIG